jgi:dUTP pyrophosphatase
MKIKKLTDTSVIPSKERVSDAGYDLYADQSLEIPAGTRALVSTGIAMEIPYSAVGLIWPRSGLSAKKGIDILAGVIDCEYRGEIKVCMLNTSETSVVISKGDKIAQILIQPVYNLELTEVDELSETSRQDKGFGSSGQ